MGVFQRKIVSFLPGFMLGRYSSILAEAVGAHLDEEAQRAFDGECAGIPYAGGARTIGGVPLQCAADVLPWHAADRGLRLFETEPEASRRYRLSRWLQLKKRRGSHLGEMQHVAPYFLGPDGHGVIPRMRIVHQSNEVVPSATWHTLSGSYDTGGAGIYSFYRKTPSNFDFDGLTQGWGRWWAFIYTPGSILDVSSTWNGGQRWNGGTVWNGVPGAVNRDLVSMFTDWQAAHSQCAGVALVHDLAAFDPTATPALVGDGTTTLPSATTLGISWGRLVDPTTGLPTRLQSATWIHDRAYQ